MSTIGGSRLLVRMIVGVLVVTALIQSGLLVSARHRKPTPVARPSVLVAGDKIPAAKLYDPWKRWPILPETRLNVAFPACGVVVFFNSTCPACERVAPGWNGADSITVSGTRLPVVWIGTSSDKGASDWLGRHGFKNSYLVKATDWRQLNVDFVPQVFIVANGMLFDRAIGRREVVEQLAIEDMACSAEG